MFTNYRLAALILTADVLGAAVAQTTYYSDEPAGTDVRNYQNQMYQPYNQGYSQQYNPPYSSQYGQQSYGQPYSTGHYGMSQSYNQPYGSSYNQSYPSPYYQPNPYSQSAGSSYAQPYGSQFGSANYGQSYQYGQPYQSGQSYAQSGLIYGSYGESRGFSPPSGQMQSYTQNQSMPMSPGQRFYPQQQPYLPGQFGSAGPRQPQMTQTAGAAPTANGVPAGWVRIGYDYDNDGDLDGVEYIFVADLNQARLASQQRAQQQGLVVVFNPVPPTSNERQEYRQYTEGRRPVIQVAGQIKDLHNANLVGARSRHEIAKIQDNQGRTHLVDLGPRSQLSDLALTTGHQITVTGMPGSINDRSVLCATSVQAGGQTVAIDRSQDMRLRHFTGQVVNVNNVTPTGSQQSHLIAEVRLPDGTIAPVDLGPSDSLRNINLTNGQSLTFLAAAGEINSQPALFARELNIDGRQVVISRGATGQPAGAIEQTQGATH